VIVGAGAQILGNITIGENAKVGSNAVVIREIPKGATAVGNPARVILQNTENQNNDAAGQLFSAYGISTEGDDPLFMVLRELINNAAAQDDQLKFLVNELKSAGIDLEGMPMKENVDPQKLGKLVE
jgi:serine O-acetyltransferase